MYAVHFGYSRSVRYSQAIELACFAHEHEVRGRGDRVWHVVRFTDDQVDLMAAIYDLVHSFGPHAICLFAGDASTTRVFTPADEDHRSNPFQMPREHLLEVEEWLHSQDTAEQPQGDALLSKDDLAQASNDMLRAWLALKRNGYLDRYAGIFPARWKKRPDEWHPGYKRIRQLIDEGNHSEAVKVYYDVLGERPFGELHGELLYLKRVAGIPLLGRDLLFFRPESSMSDLIRENRWEYCRCIDAALSDMASAGLRGPLALLAQKVPTLEQLLAGEQEKLGATSAIVTSDYFGLAVCPYGRLFLRYVNPFFYDWVGELKDDVLREAENLLRERHGLPRIGEGWVSEMKMFCIIQELFADAEHHATPSWLSPQHLDVFVPSRNLAFEYQGKQHFGPIDFFGGEDGLEATKKRDRAKAQKCRANGVRLVLWRYDEAISRTVLQRKLCALGIHV